MPKAPAIIASSNPFHNLSAGALADQLGMLKAEIAELEDREKHLRDELVCRGLGDGRCFTVIERINCRTVDKPLEMAEPSFTESYHLDQPLRNKSCRNVRVNAATKPAHFHLVEYRPLDHELIR
jgi:hypothetical protein